MKAKIKFMGEFEIPKNLPHAAGESPDDIFGDSVVADGGYLDLRSNCGHTAILCSWDDMGDHYMIHAGAPAIYEGAFGALNEIQGIDFPACEITDIESSYGQFRTLRGYKVARKFAAMAKFCEWDIEAASALAEKIVPAINPEWDKVRGIK